MKRAILLISLCGMLAGAVVLRLGHDAPVQRYVEPRRHADYTETLPREKDAPEVRFDMVAIPGGTFWMGSPADEFGRKADEGPRHPVHVGPLWMAKRELTWDEFERYTAEAGAASELDNERRLQNDADAVTGPSVPYVDPYYNHGRDSHPALGVTHHAAMV